MFYVIFHYDILDIAMIYVNISNLERQRPMECLLKYLILHIERQDVELKQREGEKKRKKTEGERRYEECRKYRHLKSLSLQLFLTIITALLQLSCLLRTNYDWGAEIAQVASARSHTWQFKQIFVDDFNSVLCATYQGCNMLL